MGSNPPYDPPLLKCRIKCSQHKDHIIIHILYGGVHLNVCLHHFICVFIIIYFVTYALFDLRTNSGVYFPQIKMLLGELADAHLETEVQVKMFLMFASKVPLCLCIAALYKLSELQVCDMWILALHC